MSYAVVQSNLGASGTPGTTVSATWGAATSPGNLCICAIIAESTGVGSPSIATPTGYSVGRTPFGGAGGSNADPRIGVFYIQNAASQSGTVSISIASANWLMYLYEISGVDTASALDQTQSSNSGTAATSAPTGTTATLTGAADFAFAVAATRLGTGQTFSAPTNGYAIDRQDQSGSTTPNGQLKAAILTNTLSGTSGTSTAVTCTSQAPSGCVLTFQAAAAASVAAYRTLMGVGG